MKPTRALIVLCFSCLLISIARAAEPVLNIAADQVAAQASPTLYGLMTEEINYSYDGGLYGELIRNRVFKGSETPRAGRGAQPVFTDANKMAHWTVVKYNGGGGEISIDAGQPLNEQLGNSLKLDATKLAANQGVGIANDGYWGIPVWPDTTYRASFYARGNGGPLTVAIESNDGATVFAKAQVPAISADWKQYTVTLKTQPGIQPSAANRFVISTTTPGTIWFNLVSLFPPTYNDRPNGNRIDLMQKLVDMKPSFLRFPGGNYVEGNDKANYFNWKITVGPLSQRPTHLSPWNYRSSDGMGLLEFLEWTEDMHAQPVLAVFAGMTLRSSFIATGDDLKPFVQDALDEIEYVTGDASTKWGAQRIADGHPAPFALNFVEVGNEDGLGGGRGPATYEARFAPFYDAIKAKYPAIKIIATAKVTDRTPDLLDEHYYFRSAEEAEIAAHKYDDRPRGQTQVFVGEWATRIPSGAPTTNLKAALADAAWMTGMERNSDLVRIASYAPLFVNMNPGGMQWAGDLIGYDAMTSYGSPSYYVQKLFGNYIGDVVLKSSMDNCPTTPYTVRTPGRRGTTEPATSKEIGLEQLYYVVTKDTAKGTIYLKVVNISGSPQPMHINIAGVKSVDSEAESTTIASADSADTNTIKEPTKVAPVSEKISGLSTSFDRTFPAYSVTLLQIGTH
jgi:alpha-N-arabinofuranosidase